MRIVPLYILNEISKVVNPALNTITALTGSWFMIACKDTIIAESKYSPPLLTGLDNVWYPNSNLN